MQIVRLSEENVYDYEQYLGVDLCEELERRFYRGIVALDEAIGEAVGGIIFELHNLEDEDKDIVSRIEWFREDKEGAGKELLEEYTQMVREEGAARSVFDIPFDRQRPERHILKESGFSAKLYEGDDIFVTMEKMENMPIVKKRIDTSKVIPVEELTVRQFRKAIDKCIEHRRTGLLEDIKYLNMQWFDTEISTCVLNGSDIAGLLLFKRHASGRVSLKLIAGFGAGAQLSIAAMMKASVLLAAQKYPSETEVVLRRHTDATILLTEKLFPTTIGYPVYRGERAEG